MGVAAAAQASHPSPGHRVRLRTPHRNQGNNVTGRRRTQYPPPQRERVSAEAIGFGAAVASAAWAAVSEFMAVQTKTVVGTILAIAAATSAGKALLEKRQERKNKDEDQ